jgi:hypothetical protein
MILRQPFLTRDEWRNRFQPNRNGDLVWYIESSKTHESIVGLECVDFVCGGSLASALENTLGYSRQKRMPLRHV